MISAKQKETGAATIKGMFVNSHITALRKKKGEEAVEELRRRFGGPIQFESLANVPIREEVTIIEIALDILNGGALVGSGRALAAGQLHFNNFAETPLGSALMRSLPRTPASFKILLRNAPSIARTVFANTEFTCAERDQNLLITISNCDYPIEHFEGFFGEWMRYWGLKDSSVQSRAAGAGLYEYRLTF